MVPTRRHLDYASGYIALGMFDDAANELEEVCFDDRLKPEVLRVRVELYHEAKEWDQLLAVAKGLAQASPDEEQGWISWAYALRELQRVSEAQEVLLKAESVYGQSSATLYYNLACYACLLGDIEEAKSRLSTACKMDADFKTSALDDPDLSAIWDNIAEME